MIMIVKCMAQSTTASLLILLVHIVIFDALSFQLDQRTARHTCALGRVHYIKSDLPVPSIQVTNSRSFEFDQCRIKKVDVCWYFSYHNSGTKMD